MRSADRPYVFVNAKKLVSLGQSRLYERPSVPAHRWLECVNLGRGSTAVGNGIRGNSMQRFAYARRRATRSPRITFVLIIRFEALQAAVDRPR